MADIDLEGVRDYLVEIADKASGMIISAHPQTSDSGTKKNSADLVTETDQAVEDMVSSSLRSKYPDIKFMGEETYKPGMKLTKDPTFIVDPIDGTTNFVHGYPYVSISLGLAINTEPVVGVVRNPFTGTLYTAVKGHGAFRSNVQSQGNTRTRLPLISDAPPLDTLNKALCAIEWGSDRTGSDYAVKTATFARLCRSEAEGGAMVHGLRSFGSAALNLCAVAEGGIDAYWEGGCWPWDVCAGWVILKEAGGIIVDGNPGEWNPPLDQRRYLSFRKGATKAVVEQFWSCVEGRMSYEP